MIFSPLGHSCVALGPHRSVFTCPVRTWSHPSHLSHLQQRVLCGCGVSVFFCFVWFCVGFVCVCVFGCFVFAFLLVFGFFCVVLLPFAPLHALALSLTGAQRTDSSFASKKKVNPPAINLPPSDGASSQALFVPQVTHSSSPCPPLNTMPLPNLHIRLSPTFPCTNAPPVLKATLRQITGLLDGDAKLCSPVMTSLEFVGLVHAS